MTGTPIENRIDDLVNIFAFVDPDRIPPETPAKPAAGPDQRLHPAADQGRGGDRHAAAHHPRRLPGTDAGPARGLRPGREGRRRPPQRPGRHHHRAARLRAGHAAQADLQLRPADRAERQARAARWPTWPRWPSSGRKAIVFSQWVEPLEYLAEALRQFGPLQYHGKVPHKERQAILDRFKSDPSKHVILMSYGTGSVGLNLQFTNYVFLFDRWWNPAVEDQAINRAHRLGQKSPVFVTRFITPGHHRGTHRRGAGEEAAAVQRADRAERPAAIAGPERGRRVRPVRPPGPAAPRCRLSDGEVQRKQSAISGQRSAKDKSCAIADR